MARFLPRSTPHLLRRVRKGLWPSDGAKPMGPSRVFASCWKTGSRSSVSAALDALAWLSDSEVATAVERALSHADDEIFQAGLRAARTLPVHDAERLVGRGLAHSAWNVRMLATKLLLDLDTEHTRQLLRQALTDETDSMVQARDRERPSARRVT